MNFTIKILLPLVLLSGFFLILTSWIIDNPKIENCVVVEVVVTSVCEAGGEFDILIQEKENKGYYINRGLKSGLSIDSLNAHVLNKKVTLHLPKLLFGAVTSSHIAQLKVGDKIIYSELN